MVICAACEKTIRRNTYSWSMGWSRTFPTFGGEGKKAFEVRFHNDPKCMTMMTQRMEIYAWDQKMAKAIDASYDERDSELVEYTEVE